MGGTGGWGLGEPLLDTINSLVEKKGATIIIAAGNDGEVHETLLTVLSVKQSRTSVSNDLGHLTLSHPPRKAFTLV